MPGRGQDDSFLVYGERWVREFIQLYELRRLHAGRPAGGVPPAWTFHAWLEGGAGGPPTTRVNDGYLDETLNISDMVTLLPLLCSAI